MAHLVAIAGQSMHRDGGLNSQCLVDTTNDPNQLNTPVWCLRRYNRTALMIIEPGKEPVLSSDPKLLISRAGTAPSNAPAAHTSDSGR